MRKKSSIDPKDNSYEKVYNRALNLLAARARSALKLREKLREKCDDEAVMDRVLARLKEQKFIDDTVYAQARARSSFAKGRSKLRASIDLSQKGIDRATAKEAVSQALDETGEPESAIAERAARKKLRSLSSFDARAQKQKLYGFLARQGFSPDSVKHAMRAVLEAPVDDDLAMDEPNKDEA